MGCEKISVLIFILILCSAPSVLWCTSEKCIELCILLFHVSIQVITFFSSHLTPCLQHHAAFFYSPFSKMFSFVFPYCFPNLSLLFFQPGCLFLPHLSQPLHWANKSPNIPRDLCPILRAVPKILVFSCMLALVVLWSRKITSGPH